LCFAETGRNLILLAYLLEPFLFPAGLQHRSRFPPSVLVLTAVGMPHRLPIIFADIHLCLHSERGGLRWKSCTNHCRLSDMIRLFAAFWFVPLCCWSRNNGGGTLLSELTNIHPYYVDDFGLQLDCFC
jgi:hypothetical protein